jgi:riboflavin kinase/FMN adenylyltransferase
MMQWNETYIGLDESPHLPECWKATGGVYALGVFDGVHLGHQAVFKEAVQIADSLGTWAGVFSFSTHPKAYFNAKPLKNLLATPEEKQSLCLSFGLSVLIMPPFNETFRNMTAHDFIDVLMKKTLGAVHLVVGHDFHFGFQRQGNAQWLLENAEALGIGVSVVEPFSQVEEGVSPEESLPISSTWIRHCLAKGQVQEAHRLMGRPYSIQGTTFAGQQKGRLLGFPTLNIRPTHPQKMIPKTGVYITATLTAGRWWQSITHIGTAPTVHGEVDTPPWLESHLLEAFPHADWVEESATVLFYEVIRPEIRFESLEALRHQIQSDVDLARRWHNAHSSGVLA